MKISKRCDKCGMPLSDKKWFRLSFNENGKRETDYNTFCESCYKQFRDAIAKSCFYRCGDASFNIHEKLGEKSKYTREEVMSLLNISDTTIRRYIDLKQLKAKRELLIKDKYHRKHVWYILSSDLEDFLIKHPKFLRNFEEAIVYTKH